MEDWKYWIALRMTYGVGEVSFRNLISRFRSPRNVFEASLEEIKRVEGIGEQTAVAIRSFSDWTKAEEEVEKIKKLGFRFLTLTDPEYPRNLFNTYDPPSYLYVRGGFLPQDAVSIAIVGTRVPDRYGRTVAERLGEELAVRGVTIISGMARGIDSIAHRGALKGGGRTIAVLGSGLDVIYPPENKKLYEEITNSGAVISEFLLGTKPDSVNFPKRNRIISGLSLGVVVVQASKRSGSLITASSALEQNREVFAVPGYVGSPLSHGVNKLIKDGAKLVESVEDIIEEIEALRVLTEKTRVISAEASPPVELSEDEMKVYSALGSEPIHIDEIAKITGISPAKLASTLLSLELAGHLKQIPGKMFIRSGT